MMIVTEPRPAVASPVKSIPVKQSLLALSLPEVAPSLVSKKMNAASIVKAVSYTHLDVYKRQIYDSAKIQTNPATYRDYP